MRKGAVWSSVTKNDEKFLNYIDIVSLLLPIYNLTLIFTLKIIIGKYEKTNDVGKIPKRSKFNN